jgi:hypothetical protein
LLIAAVNWTIDPEIISDARIVTAVAATSQRYLIEPL